MADSFNMTPGSGAQIATRLVDNKHHQRVTGDLIYFEDTVHLGTNSGATALGSGAVGTLVTDVINLVNVSLENGTDNPSGSDNGLVELVDIDLITNVDFGTNLGVMFLSRNQEAGNTLTVGSAVAIHDDNRDKVLTILPLYPVIGTKIGGLYNYTFQMQQGRHRTFMSTKGTATTYGKDLIMAFFLHTAITSWTGKRDTAAMDANPLNYRVTFDRTMI